MCDFLFQRIFFKLFFSFFTSFNCWNKKQLVMLMYFCCFMAQNVSLETWKNLTMFYGCFILLFRWFFYFLYFVRRGKRQLLSRVFGCYVATELCIVFSGSIKVNWRFFFQFWVFCGMGIFRLATCYVVKAKKMLLNFHLFHLGFTLMAYEIYWGIVHIGTGQILPSLHSHRTINHKI